MEPASRIQKTGRHQIAAHTGLELSFREDSHPLGVGDEVAVFDLDASGQPFLEGRATIIAGCPQPHTYCVRFRGEKRSSARFVNPDWQAWPDRSLVLLTGFFRTNRIANPTVADFFPDSPE
jgi:hypothetical protein